MSVYHLFDQLMLRKENLYRVLKVLRGALNQLEGFRKEAAGVEGKDSSRLVDRQNHMGEYLIFEAETGGEGNFATKPLQTIAQQLYGRRIG